MTKETTMVNLLNRGSLVVLLTSSILVSSPALADKPADALQAGTEWVGAIRQGSDEFPTTIYILERSRERIRGEIHFMVGDAEGVLTFQGQVIDGHTVAWITDKKSGNVSYPGLYLGTLKDDTLAGTWQVPSAGQYDGFSLVRRK